MSSALSSLCPAFSDSPSASPTSIPPLPHAGLTPLLLASLASASIPTAALLIYASEGDNNLPAKFLASALVKLLGLEDVEEWREPRSWAGGLLGEELGRERAGELYG